MGYALDSDHKRLARLTLYTHNKNAWHQVPPPTNRSLVLAGPCAAELGLLRWFLKLPAKACDIVDTDASRVTYARNKWRGVNAIFDEVQTVLKRQAAYRWIHLDFQGHFRPAVCDAVELAGRRLTEGGILACTFERGREQPNWTPCWDGTARFIGTDASLAGETPDDQRRYAGYTYLMHQLLSLSGFRYVPLLRLRYRASSPMGVIAFQRIPVEVDPLDEHSRRKTLRIVDVPKTADTQLRLRALDLAHQGYTDKQIAQMLNVSAGTVRAWKAHETRGTYDANAEGNK